MADTIALITGGNRGLGRSAALHLARTGIDILLTYRNGADEAAEVVAAIRNEGRRATALRLDTEEVASFPDFAAAVGGSLNEVWGRSTFDVLINNAGFGVHSAFEDTTEDDFDRQVAVHLKGPFFLTQALLPRLADGGRILNVSTGLTRFTFPGYSAYASAKGGVEVLTRYLARELGPRGIAVNTVAPGAVETDFGGGAVRDNPDLNGMIAASTAMGRVGLPDDIGGGIASLVTGSNHWMTGQRIELSGGQNL